MPDSDSSDKTEVETDSYSEKIRLQWNTRFLAVCFED